MNGKTMNLCVVGGCGNPLRARGFCNKHWIRWRNGYPLTAKSAQEKTPEEKFWESTDKRTEEECWPWVGSTRGNDRWKYGIIWMNGKLESAHRFSWVLFNGAIPALKDADSRGTCILHKCDNPLCVNPKHLFPGTHKDNMRDKLAKNRDGNKNKTHCPHGHAYTDENTYIAKQRGKRMRHCKTCHRIREANRQARLRAGG